MKPPLLDIIDEQALDTDLRLAIPVSALNLSVRSRNGLKFLEIFVVGRMLVLTENEMLRAPGFGQTSLNEIKDILAPLGLRFGTKAEFEKFTKPVKAEKAGKSKRAARSDTESDNYYSDIHEYDQNIKDHIVERLKVNQDEAAAWYRAGDFTNPHKSNMWGLPAEVAQAITSASKNAYNEIARILSRTADQITRMTFLSTEELPPGAPEPEYVSQDGVIAAALGFRPIKEIGFTAG